MKRARTLLICLLFILLSGCSDRIIDGPSFEKAELLAYSFLASKNPSLDSDVDAVITDKSIHLSIPALADTESLIATFETTGQMVLIDGAIQTSGSTPNDFSSPIVYTVIGADGYSSQYTVSVGIEAKPEIELSSFVILKENNPVLSADVEGVINGDDIYLDLPFSVAGVSLSPSFVFAGDSVLVDGIEQKNGLSSQEFGDPVEYLVTSEAGESHRYTVHTQFVRENTPGVPNVSQVRGAVSEDPFVFYFAAKSFSEPCDVDDDGIPFDFVDGERFYNPVEIAQTALSLARSGFPDTTGGAGQDRFLSLANWFLENAVQTNDQAVWLYYIDYPIFNASSPWTSAMAQGLILPVLLQAYQLTSNSNYIELANAALKAFSIPIEDGGVVRYLDDGLHRWYEEYAGAEESRVLNGTVFSLAGLFYYAVHTGSENAFQLFRQGEQAVAYYLDDYDAGYWSYYCIDGRPEPIAKSGYHLLHVEQLLWLYAATGDDRYFCTAETFLSYVTNGTSLEGVELGVIDGVEASLPIDPESYGSSNLFDGNWTYGKYYSSRSYPVEIEMSFSRNVTGVEAIVFACPVQISKKPDFVIFHSNDEETWTELNETQWAPTVSATVDVSGPGATVSYVYRIDIKPKINEAKSFRICFSEGPNILAFRKIWPIFDRINETAHFVSVFGFQN